MSLPRKVYFLIAGIFFFFLLLGSVHHQAGGFDGLKNSLSASLGNQDPQEKSPFDVGGQFTDTEDATEPIINVAELDPSSLDVETVITLSGDGVGALGTDFTPLLESIEEPPGMSSTGNLETMYELGVKWETDKVTTHKYHNMYSKYLEPLRREKFRMLEIGLGCDMTYGPGHSYNLWLDAFPNVELFFIEYDKACATKWQGKTDRATVFAGDQADVGFLHQFLKETGGQFDVIIDDGGHSMHQQKTSLLELFRAVKPGGLYFVEDTQTSYYGPYGGGPRNKDGTFVQMVKEMLDDLHSDIGTEKLSSGPEAYPVSKYVQSIDFMEEVVAFTKRTARQMMEHGYDTEDINYVFDVSKADNASNAVSQSVEGVSTTVERLAVVTPIFRD